MFTFQLQTHLFNEFITHFTLFNIIIVMLTFQLQTHLFN
jgi:hypothetical protein